MFWWLFYQFLCTHEMHLTISFRVSLVAWAHSYDYPSTSEITKTDQHLTTTKPSKTWTVHTFNPLSPGRSEGNFRDVMFKLISVMIVEVSLVKLPSGDCLWGSLMMSQHWFRLWFGAVRQQTITWANVDTDLCRHMASLGPNELKFWLCCDEFSQFEGQCCILLHQGSVF